MKIIPFLVILPMMLSCSPRAEVVEEPDARRHAMNQTISSQEETEMASVRYVGRYSAAWWDDSGTFLYGERMVEEEDNCFHIFTIEPTGEPIRCLTCEHPQLQTQDEGHPNISPDGRWMVFIARPKTFWPACWIVGPGQGVLHDIYVMDLHSPLPHNVYKLHTVHPQEGGTLLPKFSHDGQRLAWTDKEIGKADTMFGNWRIAIAQFQTAPTPHLTDLAYYDPAGRQNAFYEFQRWGDSDTWLYFACEDMPGQVTWGLDICRMELPDGTLTRLTRTSGMHGELKTYEEHASLSPTGDTIAYMSSYPAEHPSNNDGLLSLVSIKQWHTDLWFMNTDGSNQRQVTFFNQPGHPHYDLVAPFRGDGKAIAIVSSWHPDGKQIALSVQFFGHPGPLSNREQLFSIC